MRPAPAPAPAGLVAVPSRFAEDLAEVRAWARSRGYPVDERGPVPLSVLRTYRRVRAAA